MSNTQRTWAFVLVPSYDKWATAHRSPVLATRTRLRFPGAKVAQASGVGVTDVCPLLYCTATGSSMTSDGVITARVLAGVKTHYPMYGT